ncbi:MAG: hypothetical protein H0U27_00365 [Nitrosopumilus sp.]|nr:hypothetical protein [Nitrosopumilus sp.]
MNSILKMDKAMAKNGSFGFAVGSACGWGKTKCAICAAAIEIHFFRAVAVF